MNPDLKRRVIELGVFLVPVILAKAVIPMFGGGGPEAARASGKVTKDPQGTLVIDDDVWTDEQVRAAEHLQSLAASAVAASPFDHGEAPEQTTDPVNEDPAEAPGELDVLVTMIMNTAGGGVALIDGRACRVGDTVSGGLWRITAITAADRTVEFENIETGEAEERSLDR